jgi:hypothetical protein
MMTGVSQDQGGAMRDLASRRREMYCIALIDSRTSPVTRRVQAGRQTGGSIAIGAGRRGGGGPDMEGMNELMTCVLTRC